MKDRDAIWQRVRQCAIKHENSGKVIHTLAREVPNVITDVTDTSIGRRSEQGRTNSSRVTRQMVLDAWDTVVTGQPHGDPLYFTYALLLAAFPDKLVKRDGRLELRGSGA